MNKDKYRNAMEQLRLSEGFNYETAGKMKAELHGGQEAVLIRNQETVLPREQEEVLPRNQKVVLLKKPEVRRYFMRTAFAVAGAVIILTAGVYTVNRSGIFHSQSGITIEEIKLPTSEDGIKARMRPLFVYQGRIYIKYGTAIESSDGYTISETDMLNLRGDYLGTTTGGIDEWSGDKEYATNLISNIGESEVYTVKGYDSKYRLMIYTPYDGGFGCEIYDSFGGLTMNSGEDYFGLLNLKDHVVSYQWENLDSWNNGGAQKTEEQADGALNKFIKELYSSTPVERSIDTLIDETSVDSQKFLYLKTEDNLISAIRLLKDGFVYVDDIGFFRVNQTAFQDFYNSLQ